MSLITDALKRAQNTTDQQPGQTPPPVIASPLKNQYADVPQERNERSRSGLLVVVLIVVLVAAGGMTMRAWRTLRQRTPIPVASKAATAADTPAKPQVASSNPAESTPITRPPENVKTEQVAAAAPPLEPPKLTLQGVMIEGQDREAVINGVSVHVGDDLEGARVTAIDTRNVRLQFGDREILLRLP
jgi:hypothetical protein